MLKVLQQETMEVMSKNAGTKVIFVDKNTQMNENQSMLQALEAFSADNKKKSDDVVWFVRFKI